MADQADRLASENLNTENVVKQRWTEYQESIKKMKESFESLQETRHKSKAAVKEANAETQAAQSDGVVSPWEAAALIDEEAYAKKVNRRIERKALKESARYFGQGVLQGGALVLGNGKLTLESAFETITDKDSWKTLAFGGAAGLFLGDGPLSSMVSDMAGSVLGLKGVQLDEGVDEKQIDGFATEEEQAQYFANNAGGESSGYHDPGEGSDPADEKDIPGGTGTTQVDINDDALQTTEEQFTVMAKAGESLTDFLKESENPLFNMLGEAIATPGAQAAFQAVTSKTMEILNGKLADMDKNDPAAGIQDPDFGDLGA